MLVFHKKKLTSGIESEINTLKNIFEIIHKTISYNLPVLLSMKKRSSLNPLSSGPILPRSKAWYIHGWTTYDNVIFGIYVISVEFKVVRTKTSLSSGITRVSGTHTATAQRPGRDTLIVQNHNILFGTRKNMSFIRVKYRYLFSCRHACVWHDACQQCMFEDVLERA